jgi:hypothetical protein
MKFEEAVRQITEATKSNWIIGDAALEVELKYGEGTLEHLAEETGVEFEILRKYRYVSESYEKGIRIPNSSWTVHRIFAAQEDRAELVKRKWTAAKARAEVKRRNEEVAPEPGPVPPRPRPNPPKPPPADPDGGGKEFEGFYNEFRQWMGMVKNIMFPQDDRERLAELLELAAQELRKEL